MDEYLRLSEYEAKRKVLEMKERGEIDARTALEMICEINAKENALIQEHVAHINERIYQSNLKRY